MQRRDFLIGTAASAAAMAGWSGIAAAQGRGQGRGGQGGSPANVSPDKLARIALMTLNFNSILKLPTQEATPERTLDLLDLPQMYVDVYGVHNIEFQHSHLVQAEKDPAFTKEIKARVDAAKSQVTQINMEFGPQNISNPDPALRQQAIDHTKQWIDIAVALGCPRVMLNQGPLSPETKAHAIETWKAMNEYGKSKNVKVSAETRGGATAPMAWVLLKEVIEASGGHSNVDIGNVGAQSQDALHECIKALAPTSSGNLHVKSSPFWDMGAAVRFINGTLGYKGLYSIEVNTHPAVRIVYNTILANL
jgi:sugar phosphate isomerase/epimerase